MRPIDLRACGVQAKMDWAKVKFDDLVAWHTEWVEENLSAFAPTFAEEFDVQDGCLVLRQNPLPQVPDDWALIVGDIAHNFRCALDYVVWELVDVGAKVKPISDPENVQFPIIWKTNKAGHAFDRIFRDKAKRHLPGVEPGLVNLVELAQPYSNSPADPGSDPLALLARLSNYDKHRRTQVSAMQYGSALVLPNVVRVDNFELAEPPRRSIKGVVSTSLGNIDPQTIEVRVFGRPVGAGKPHVEVATQWEYVVTFTDLGVPVLESLLSMGNRVAQVVRTFDPSPPQPAHHPSTDRETP